ETRIIDLCPLPVGTGLREAAGELLARLVELEVPRDSRLTAELARTAPTRRASEVRRKGAAFGTCAQLGIGIEKPGIPAGDRSKVDPRCNAIDRPTAGIDNDIQKVGISHPVQSSAVSRAV